MTSIRASLTPSGVERIEIIDQLLLPHTTSWIEIDTIEKAWDAIRSMKVTPSPSHSHARSLDADPRRPRHRIPRRACARAAPHAGTRTGRAPRMARRAARAASTRPGAA